MTNSSEYELTVLYGSQTGNAEYLAFNVSETAKAAGLTAELLTLNDALERGNLSWQRLLIVTSTHDNGHMPDNANGFWNWLQTCQKGQFEGLPFAVLAIGDSMYDDFCKAGKDFDLKLRELGANTIQDRIDCDVDYDMTSEKWIKTFIEAAKAVQPWNPEDSGSVETVDSAEFIDAPESWYEGKIVSARELTSQGSNKKVLHFDLEMDSKFSYIPGDSVEIAVENSDELVSDWKNYFPDVEAVSLKGEFINFEKALRTLWEIRIPQLTTVKELLAISPDSEQRKKILHLVENGDRQQLDTWLWGKDVLEIVSLLGLNSSHVEEVANSLRPIQLRSYSIASSPVAEPQKLSLTVSIINYELNGRKHLGAGTQYLEHAMKYTKIVKARRVVAHEFRLPNDSSPIIMIGPGVGIAPFIGFIQHLQAEHAQNRTWLFFGDQHEATDSLYRHELDEWVASGALSKLNRAFSRDQEKKNYVQDDLISHSAEISQWVKDGAHIYICGDKNHMARDVEKALVEILADGQSENVGKEKLEKLKNIGKYAKDVY
jgi:sulfite reductase (NADPH) flavoprotein alpha-component